MKNYCEPFRGKRITVLGLGLLGRGVGDVEFLAKCGANILVTDMKTERELAPSVEKLRAFKNVTFRLGGHREEDFTRCDLVIKAAGVPLDSPYVAAAREAGVPVAMSTALFAKMAAEAGATIVGVTGTRGKSTIAHMIYHCLIYAKKNVGLNRAEGAVGRTVLHGNIVLGGNVRGISTLAMLLDIEAGDICVLELDSWQLQGFGDLQISPHISIMSNLMPDHMNYYGGNLDTYFSDKANIFRFQMKGDSLFVGEAILEKVRAVSAKWRTSVEATVPPAIPKEWKLSIVGEHNRQNASLAAAALRALGLSEVEIKEEIESFEGIAGRLQFIGEVKGIPVYNDNNATTPEATIAALRALGEDITLIAGGSEKNLALEELVSEIKQRVARVVLLKHPNYQGSERLARTLRKEEVSFEEASDLKGAVEMAIRGKKSGSILFSPAFASFGMFKNEYDRNDQFLKIVSEL